MAGIAGIDLPGRQKQVRQMLGRIKHRGKSSVKVLDLMGATLGAVWTDVEAVPTPPTLRQRAVWDRKLPPLPTPKALADHREPFALAVENSQGLFVSRDLVGVQPLYYGYTQEGGFCFASEVKALLGITKKIREFPPGHFYTKTVGFQPFANLSFERAVEDQSKVVALELRMRLEQAIVRHMDGNFTGCWLSGGLDSSTIAVLLRPHVHRLHTFAGGLADSSDIQYARQVAEFLKTEHHEILVTPQRLLQVLSEVIYSLESFDALLVRSSIVNYLVGQHASNYVASAFSGEGGDELFGGYDYLKGLDRSELPAELLDITQRLHNTALQRVDRCASAHGLVVYVPFLDPDVVEFALSIPAELKLYQNGGLIEKWILRQAIKDLLPDQILWRPKDKFWRGSGVGDLLSSYADEIISDNDFNKQRYLPNGWLLNTKEELMYYRTFLNAFGELEDLSWMGRTKGAPKQIS